MHKINGNSVIRLKKCHKTVYDFKILVLFFLRELFATIMLQTVSNLTAKCYKTSLI